VNPDFRGAAAACSACGGSSAAAVRHAEAVSLCVLPFKHSGGERRSMPLPLKINFQTILADKYALTKRIVPEMTVLFQKLQPSPNNCSSNCYQLNQSVAIVKNLFLTRRRFFVRMINDAFTGIRGKNRPHRVFHSDKKFENQTDFG